MDEEIHRILEAVGSSFYVRCSSHSLEVVFIFLPIIFLPLAFQNSLAVGFPKFNGRIMNGEYQMLLTNCCKQKKHVFECAQKMSA
jgi:hypothetical protein